MAKRYIRLNWQNRPSVATPINATNLNKMDRAIDDIDNAVEDLYAVKLNTANIANNLVTTVAGLALDARQGKALQDQITQQNNNLVAYGYQTPVSVYDLNSVPINVRSTVFCPWGDNASKPNNHNIIMETIPLTGATTALQIAYDYDATAVLSSPLIFMRYKNTVDKSEWNPVGGGKVSGNNAISQYCNIVVGGYTRNSINIIVGLRINVHTQIPAYTNFIEWFPSSLTGFSPLNCMKASGEFINSVYISGASMASKESIPVGEYMINGSYISHE